LGFLWFAFLEESTFSEILETVASSCRFYLQDLTLIAISSFDDSIIWCL